MASGGLHAGCLNRVLAGSRSEVVNAYECYIDQGGDILKLTKQQLSDVKDGYEGLGNHFGAQDVDRVLERRQGGARTRE